MSKGLMIFAHHMEDGEALFTRALLKRSGLQIDAVSIEEKREVKTAFDLAVKADFLLSEINPMDYDFLVIPGGKYVNEIIQKNTTIVPLILKFNEANKMIAAICAGPRFLGKAGVLEHKNFTCFPGSEQDMKTGIYLKNAKVVTDQHIITARSAGAVYEFANAIVSYQLGHQKALDLYENIIY